MIFLQSIAIIAGLTFCLATGLVLAGRLLAVVEDPRIDEVERLLPATNCGGCGFPGCRAFAEALVAGKSRPAVCTVSTVPQREKIAAYLGVAVGEMVQRVARIACAGGSHTARVRAHYQGPPSCAAAALVAGGGKACFWGCLGLADCAQACDFDAIEMDVHHLPVVDPDRCTACGDCVTACPKDLFSLQPANQHLWVACSSLAQGDEILADCEVGCTACGRCAMDSHGRIEMKQGLPVINTSGPPLTAEPAQRCPTGAIVWLDEHERAHKGPSATKIIRHGDLGETAT